MEPLVLIQIQQRQRPDHIPSFTLSLPVASIILGNQASQRQKSETIDTTAGGVIILKELAFSD